MCSSVFRRSSPSIGEDHHEVFVRAQMSRALYSDVEAWDERRQTQPIQDADAEIQDSHGMDSRRESPGPILDLGLSSRPRDLKARPVGGGSLPRRTRFPLLGIDRRFPPRCDRVHP